MKKLEWHFYQGQTIRSCYVHHFCVCVRVCVAAVKSLNVYIALWPQRQRNENKIEKMESHWNVIIMNKMFGFLKSCGSSWQSLWVRAGVRTHAQICPIGLPLMDESITNFWSIQYGRQASVVIFFFFIIEEWIKYSQKHYGITILDLL